MRSDEDKSTETQERRNTSSLRPLQSQNGEIELVGVHRRREEEEEVREGG